MPSPKFYHLLVAIQFLTRIPIKLDKAPDRSDLSLCGVYFPLVGLILGLITFLCAEILIFLELPISLVAILCLTLLVCLTGGFHIDGLGDTFDGIGGAFTKQKKLEIMRDSRIGTYGSLAIMLFILFRYTAYSENSKLSTLSFWILPLMFGRLSSLIAIRFLPYARVEESNKSSNQKPVVESLKESNLGIALIYSILIAWISVGASQTLLILFLFSITCFVSFYFFRKQIGGLTGDVLGGINLLVEAVILALFLI